MHTCLKYGVLVGTAVTLHGCGDNKPENKEDVQGSLRRVQDETQKAGKQMIDSVTKSAGTVAREAHKQLEKSLLTMNVNANVKSAMDMLHAFAKDHGDVHSVKTQVIDFLHGHEGDVQDGVTQAMELAKKLMKDVQIDDNLLKFVNGEPTNIKAQIDAALDTSFKTAVNTAQKSQSELENQVKALETLLNENGVNVNTHFHDKLTKGIAQAGELFKQTGYSKDTVDTALKTVSLYLKDCSKNFEGLKVDPTKFEKQINDAVKQAFTQVQKTITKAETQAINLQKKESYFVKQMQNGAQGAQKAALDYLKEFEKVTKK
jgi:hypothetical protein